MQKDRHEKHLSQAKAAEDYWKNKKFQENIMRIYYCQCGQRTEVSSGEAKECKCGKTFGVSGKISDYINMRNTLSHTTKIEFSESSLDKSMSKMKGQS